jgi:hypothetical protein
MECGAQPRSGFTAERESKVLQRRGQVHRALRRRPHQLGQAFSKALSRTAGVQAAKAADVQDQTHGVPPQRKVARAARVVAMDALRRFPTARATGRGRSGMGGDREDTVALPHRAHLAPRYSKGRSR